MLDTLPHGVSNLIAFKRGKKVSVKSTLAWRLRGTRNEWGELCYHVFTKSIQVDIDVKIKHQNSDYILYSINSTRWNFPDPPAVLALMET